MAFHNCRSSSTDGLGLSPWAVKRTRARTNCGQETTDNFVDKRLAKEAGILKQLKHDNIVGFRAFGHSADGRLCLSMEKEEQSLLDLIEKRDEKGLGPFPAAQIYHVALGIARALRYLHQDKYLLHGDLKSGNVLIGDNFKTVKLCDFGVALKLKEDLTGCENSDEEYMCSEPWSAPEVFNEDEPVVITDKTDIFSYGLVVWEMMSLTVPHVDLLVDSMCDDDESCNESFLEDRYQMALGTRPPPPNFPLGTEYKPFMSLFWACTEELPSNRPSAGFIVEALELIPIPGVQTSTEMLPKMDLSQ